MKAKKTALGIGALFQNIPNLYECKDGAYTTSESRRGCSRHGGKKTGEPISFGGSISKLGIKDIPLSQVNIDKSLFQGREKDYSERSVENIVNDVQEGNFVWANLDPITVWQSNRDQDAGKMYLLSGHSRFEAFRRLYKAGLTADGKDFSSIPAKVLKNTGIDRARKIALESNTLSTKETEIERAKYYRKLRQDGTDEKKLTDQIKKNEGKEWVNIYAYTFLNPDGKTMAALRQFIEKGDTSAVLMKSLAKWIGAARRNFRGLTNYHESELYDWLVTDKGYGTGSGKVSNEREFQEKVDFFVQKNTFFGNFDAEKPLNIRQALYKSPVEQEYDDRINEARQLLSDAERELKQKIKSLTDRGATKADIQRIVEPIEARIRNQRINLQKLIQKKSEVIEYSKREVELFGIGRIYSPFFRR